MNPLTHYMGKKNKLSYILKKANTLGFYDMNVDNNAFKTLALIKDDCFDKRVQSKLEYLSINLDFRKLWLSQKAKEEVNFVRKTKCFCTHECFNAVNILFNPKFYPKLIKTAATIK